MISPTDVLRAGSGGPRATLAGQRPIAVVLLGGGGALGSAVLERLLGRRGFAPVRVLVSRGLSAAVQGLEAVVVDGWSAAVADRPIGEVGIVVFDRERHANGRELAFIRPRPEELPQVAAWLAARGVRRLLVVLPHAPHTLPEALKTGLATLDEQAVAMLGFEQLVLVRSAQAPPAVRSRRFLQRVADGALAQLRFMVPASNLPVRPTKVAQFVAELALQLRDRPPGTRVAPPELVWQAAQLRDPAGLVGAWLDGRELPLPPAPEVRKARRRTAA